MRLKWLFESVIRRGQVLTFITFFVLVTTTTPYSVIAQCSTDLSTIINSNNNQRGIVFDITATNAVLIQRFASALAGTSAATYEIYYKSGSYMGSETTAGDWTLAGSTSINPNNGSIVSTQTIDIPIDVNVTIPAGQTYGFYITFTVNTHFTLYTTGSGAFPETLVSDANISITDGIALNYPFIPSALNRNPNIKVTYRSLSTPVNIWTGSWSPSAPGAGDCVLINDDYNVQNHGNINSGEIIVATGVDLTMTSGAIQLTGDFTNNGNAFTQSGGTFTFNGSASQSISGDNSFKNLTINNSAGVTLNSTTDVTGVLDLENGGLTSNGNLTLKSTGTDADETARVDFSGTGSVVGNVTAERFLDGATQAGYRYISTNIIGERISDVNDDFTLVGVGTKFSPGSGAGYTWNTASPYPNAFLYDEALISGGSAGTGPLNGQSLNNASYGWETPANLSDFLNVVTGIALRVSSDETIKFTGELQTADATRTLTHGGQSESGWNLVANSFMATLDWNALYEDASTTGVEPTAYIFDANSAYSGVYRGYNAFTDAGVNDGGANGVKNIAPGQAFFVRAMSGGGSLTAKTSHTSTSGTEFFRTKRTDWQGELRMKLADADGNEDELLLYFIEGMSEEKDLGDATKFFEHANGFPKLASKAFGKELMMDCRAPIGTETQTFNLALKAGKAGEYTLKASEIAQFPLETEIMLEDLQMGIQLDLNQVNEYKFELAKDELAENRFRIHLKSDRVTSISDDLAKTGVSIRSSSNRLFINFSDLQSSNSNIAIYDLTGRLILTQSNQSKTQLTLELPNSGIFIVKVENAKGVMTKKVYLE